MTPYMRQNSADIQYVYYEYPLEYDAVKLHLDSMEAAGTNPKKNILLVHGVTLSSHEFDVQYQDYSLVRRLVQEGYRVWRIDIAGYGQSEAVKDGFMPDSDYAAENIAAATALIGKETEQDRIDILGWSWGTVTVSRFAAKHPEYLNKVVLYAPILSGIGYDEVTAPFYHITWEDAVDDFQKAADGTVDSRIADPVVVGLWCSDCWRYDGDSSPNGGRRDICVDRSQKLIDLTRIQSPTLVICGDRDSYLNYDLVNACLEDLPKGSALEIILGGSHVVFVEKPYYRDFQDRVTGFLRR